MGKYSIKELEKLSGIKAHTIRIWEKRHKLIIPQRTPTNIRFYSDDDLKKIINVSVLNNSGFKISKIVRMSFEEINQRILDMNNFEPRADVYIDRLVVTMVDMDEEALQKLLVELIRKMGFERCITEVVYPFMEKIGLLWQTGTIIPAQEHFISNLIRQTIITSIAGLPMAPKKARKAILFLPEGELHEIGLLFYNYILRSKGFKTYYLGQSVPHSDLVSVYNTHRPEILITSRISLPSPKHLQTFVQRLAQDFKNATILVSGLMVRKTAFYVPKNVKSFYRATELTALLELS